MRQRDLERTKKLLLDRRRALVQLVDHLATEGEGATGRAPDWIDLAANQRDAAVSQRVGVREHREIREVNAALARIDAGEYGLCESCSEPIETRRLQAMPEARRCMECSGAAERANRAVGLRAHL